MRPAEDRGGQHWLLPPTLFSLLQPVLLWADGARLAKADNPNLRTFSTLETLKQLPTSLQVRQMAVSTLAMPARSHSAHNSAQRWPYTASAMLACSHQLACGE